jgi:hypothetical protein
MSRRIPKRTLLVLLILIFGTGSVTAGRARPTYYKQSLTIAAQRCLREILQTGNWRHSPDLQKKMMSVAVSAQANLDGPARKQYIYVMKDFSFCGTAGCSMLIGETSPGGSCHEIYSDAGSEVAITVLQQRDHGYRRLLTPCEVRFNGREYEKLHDECPNINVQR